MRAAIKMGMDTFDARSKVSMSKSMPLRLRLVAEFFGRYSGDMTAEIANSKYLSITRGVFANYLTIRVIKF